MRSPLKAVGRHCAPHFLCFHLETPRLLDCDAGTFIDMRQYLGVCMSAEQLCVGSRVTAIHKQNHLPVVLPISLLFPFLSLLHSSFFRFPRLPSSCSLFFFSLSLLFLSPASFLSSPFPTFPPCSPLSFSFHVWLSHLPLLFASSIFPLCPLPSFPSPVSTALPTFPWLVFCFLFFVLLLASHHSL